jgi:hypothetical protein
LLKRLLAAVVVRLYAGQVFIPPFQFEKFIALVVTESFANKLRWDTSNNGVRWYVFSDYTTGCYDGSIAYANIIHD